MQSLRPNERLCLIYVCKHLPTPFLGPRIKKQQRMIIPLFVGGWDL